ncbi:MAG TPA: hypothetical protein VF817_03835 [Patescibacteria group bacterium]
MKTILERKEKLQKELAELDEVMAYIQHRKAQFGKSECIRAEQFYNYWDLTFLSEVEICGKTTTDERTLRFHPSKR